MMAPVSSEAARRLVQPVVLQHLAEVLARSLERIAAKHGDDAEVLDVCEKWTLRLSELKRRSAAVDAQRTRR